MKITCPSCAARYSIDDAKVKGKAFKFTCKKCGQTHVYRGTTDGAAAAVSGGAPAGASPAGGAPLGASGGDGDAVWYVAVGEEQQGPYTTQQIREYIQTDQLDPESFMWKEGMEDWLPVQQVAEFADTMGSGAAAPAPAAAPSPFGGGTEEATVASPFSPAAAAQGDAGDLFAFGGASAPAATPAKAAVPQSADPSPFGAFGGGGSAAVASRGGADLFGAPAAGGASPFESPGEEREEDVMMGAAASAPSPRVDARKMIGQRNENSVLFSLSSLQALGAGRPAAAAAPAAAAPSAPRAGFATGEGSGLIDIKAMAGAATKQEERHDDLFSLGGGAIGAPVAVPILTRPIRHEEESKRPMYLLIGIIGAFAVAIVVLLVFLLGRKESKPAAPAQTVAMLADAGPTLTADDIEKIKQEAAAAAIAAARAEQDAGSSAAAQNKAADAGAAAPDVAPGDADPNAKAADAADGGAAEHPGANPHGTGGHPQAGHHEEHGGTGPVPPPPPPPPPQHDGGTGATRDTGHVAGDLSSLLGHHDTSPTTQTDTSSLPATPSRDEVRSKLESVRGAVRACTGNQAGTASVALAIQGSSGRVTRVNVTGDFTGPAATCIGNAIRGLQFAPFANASQPVQYSYTF